MQEGLLAAALLTGLLGGPHCVAMCGAPSSALVQVLRPLPAAAPAARLHTGLGFFHAGRIASYASAGALVAGLSQSLSLAAQQAAVLQPLWVLLHASILAWGLALLVRGRQPAWAHGLGRSLARRLALHTGGSWGLLSAGAMWVLMPCGLLYSALALASLGNGPLEGGLAMLAFALGSGLSLASAPWLWQRFSARLAPGAQGWGTRAAGLMLTLLAGSALWMDLARQWALWCAQ